MALPEGVMEQMQVTCNGKSGTFVVRAQRVLVGGVEYTASRFEAMCGKGDAKKWKSSLYAVGEDGEPELGSRSRVKGKGLGRQMKRRRMKN
eukprot:gene14033-14148_t